MTASIFRSALATKRLPQSHAPQGTQSLAAEHVSRSADAATYVTAPAPGAIVSQPAATPEQPQKQTWASSCDVALVAILEAPLHGGETVAAGFARKELELRHVFASLSVLESRALQKRLSNPKPDDQLAKSFMRLTADRRARLINFLADVRRREAMTR